MEFRLRLNLPCLVWLLVSATPSAAQTALPMPSCEPPEPVRQEMEQRLDWKVLRKMKGAERLAYQREVLEQIIAKYPREVEPARRLIDTVRWEDPEGFSALQDRFRKQAAQHPDDALAQYLAGFALLRSNTPETIRLLEKAKTVAPSYPWPYRVLADIYSGGRLADAKAMMENIRAFFALCPDSVNGTAHSILAKTGDKALQAKVASAIRARLEKVTFPTRLVEYKDLWGLEFRLRQPQEYEAVRKQVAADLKRLELLNPKPDAEWQTFLIHGYRLSGDSPETITAMEDRLILKYPHSDEAFGIVRERWGKTHEEPEDQEDASAWTKYRQEYKEAVKGWMRSYPDNEYLAHYAWFDAISDDDNVSEEEGLAALNDFVSASDEQPQRNAWNYVTAAWFLLNRKWQPERAVTLLHRAMTLLVKQKELGKDDLLTDAEQKQNKEMEASQEKEFISWRLQIAKVGRKPEDAAALKPLIEGPLPKKKEDHPGYWWNRASLALLENRKTDALAYYQLALQTRMQLPQAWHGKKRDALMEEAHALWKETGGSEVAWDVWNKAPVKKVQELTDGRWEKATKTMPAFELLDMTGKTWRVKELGGKSVLINLWATWCGPCRAELPHLQKLYEKVKDRSDVQILTFNYDDNPGVITPYMKQEGFTFPVLPAYDFVTGVLDSIFLPQNWILDPKGGWRWTQFGFGIDPAWEEDMLRKLESVKREE